MQTVNSPVPTPRKIFFTEQCLSSNFYFILASFVYTTVKEKFLHYVQILPLVLTFLISVGAAKDQRSP